MYVAFGHQAGHVFVAFGHRFSPFRSVTGRPHPGHQRLPEPRYAQDKQLSKQKSVKYF